MDVNVAYEKFIIKINDNSTTDNVACDKGRFIYLFNENQNKYIEYTLDKRNEDDIRYVQKLLVPDAKISSSSKKKTYDLFQLPENFFDFANVYAMASSDCCSNERINLHEIKSENENYKLQDEFWKPSFEYRESLFYIAEDSIKVFKDGFTINNIFLTYYRYPVQIKLQDEEDPESKFANINPELDDKVVDRIISNAASDFKLNTSDPSFQANKQEAISKI